MTLYKNLTSQAYNKQLFVQYTEDKIYATDQPYDFSFRIDKDFSGLANIDDFRYTLRLKGYVVKRTGTEPLFLTSDMIQSEPFLALLIDNQQIDLTNQDVELSQPLYSRQIYRIQFYLDKNKKTLAIGEGMTEVYLFFEYRAVNLNAVRSLS